MVYAALLTLRPLLMLVNAGAISTIKRAMMPTTMRSSTSVKAQRAFACKVGYFTGEGSVLSRTQGLLRKLGAKVPKTLNNNCPCLSQPQLEGAKRAIRRTNRKSRPPRIDACLSALQGADSDHTDNGVLKPNAPVLSKCPFQNII